MTSSDDSAAPPSPTVMCDFSNAAQPDPILQCECNGNITVLNEEKASTTILTRVNLRMWHFSGWLWTKKKSDHLRA